MKVVFLEKLFVLVNSGELVCTGYKVLIEKLRREENFMYSKAVNR
jgi:hypothetical protein